MRVGDQTLAGDMSFDPLMISDTPEQLAWYREAEVKHARLAMLAAFGWPISEITNFGGLLQNDGRAPALLGIEPLALEPRLSDFADLALVDEGGRAQARLRVCRPDRRAACAGDAGDGCERCGRQ